MIRKFLILVAVCGLMFAGCSSVMRDNSTLSGMTNHSSNPDNQEALAENDTTENDTTNQNLIEARQKMEEIRLAEEYYSFGAQANAAERWQEAQYNFEKALSILSDLDIDVELPTAVTYSYSKLLEEIRSEYKLTLLYLASVPGEASSSAFVDRFSEIDDFGKLKDEKTVTEVDKTQEYDIPLVVNDKVENCIIYFQTLAHDFFQGALTRSGKYTKLMSKILEEENVPKDLVYLPLIESGFKTNAYSWASAVGPWQFISSTGRRYGMDRDWWFDERRDFEKSTRAAARYLKTLHERYDDWYLALAGYNGGEGRVDQAIARDHTNDYWKLTKLKRETKDYVPLFLAAMVIAKNPEKYGFVPFYDEPLSYDIVTVDKCLDLYEVADALGTSYDYLKQLNPELLRKLTHPSKESYQLRIPKDQSDKFWGVYTQMRSSRSTTLVHHTIGKGESLASIAKQYSVSVQSLADANNINRKQGITSGRTILIPVPTQSRATRVKKAPTKKSFDADQDSNNSKLYVVRRGDSISDIADDHGVTVGQLLKKNGLDDANKIFPGQVLNVGASKTASNKRSNAKTTKIQSYKVREGDNLEKIAGEHGTTVADLRLLNGLDNRGRIRVGQLINVPAFKQTNKSSGGILVYVVKAGDTIWDIAKAFSCSVDDIIRLNNLRSPKLNVGDRLRVSSKG